MNRRNALAAGLGVAAALAGGTWSWWRRRSDDTASAVSQNEAEAALASVWALRLQQPQGGELALATLKGRPLVLNFWATWCPPCVKEMPELDRFARTFAHQGWRVAGIAIDSLEPVRAFLQKTPVSFPIGLAGPAGTSLVRALGNPAGGLPFTLVFDSTGRIAQRSLGATDYAQLTAWAANIR